MIFSCLISLPFLGLKSVHSFAISAMADHIKARKDVFYRLKNNTSICWRMILWLFSMKAIKLAASHGERANGFLKCLVLDDSFLLKTGRYIENISRMYDNVSKQFLLGYKLFAMGYWDGGAFLPLDFSLHREKGSSQDKPYGLKKKEYRKQYKKNRENGTHSWDRAKEADMSKIDSALKMFWRAISQGVKVD